MIANITKAIAAGYVMYKVYKRMEKLMLSDEKYLSRISDHDGELISKTIEEARKHVKDKEYGLAAEYFYYAHKLLDCSWDFIISQVNSEEVREILQLKKGVNPTEEAC